MLFLDEMNDVQMMFWGTGGDGFLSVSTIRGSGHVYGIYPQMARDSL